MESKDKQKYQAGIPGWVPLSQWCYHLSLIEHYFLHKVTGWLFGNKTWLWLFLVLTCVNKLIELILVISIDLISNHMEQQIHSMLPWLIPIIIILALWDAVWKLIGMWKAARNNHLAWFLCIFIFNTIGILPIIYILIQKGKSEIVTW